MGNNDFKIILEALLDQTSLTEIEKKLAKKKIPLGIDFEFAKSIKNAEKQMDELSARFKSIFNLSDNDARTFAKQYFAEANKAITQNEQAIQRAAKAQDSLTASMARGREKAEQLRQTEEKRQQISQSNAINKNLEQEYLQREKIASINNSISEKVQSKIDVGDYDVQIAKIQNGYSKLNLTIEESANKMSSLSAAYSRLQNAKTVDERVNAEKKFQVELKKTTNDLTKSQIGYSTAFKPITELQRINLSTKMQKWLDINTAASKKFGVRITELIEKCAILNGSEFYKLEAQFKSIINEAAAAGKVGKSFGDTMHAGIQKFTEWGIASRIVMGVVQSFKDGLKFIGDIDDAMTDVAYTSDITASGLEKLGNSSISMAKDLNTSATNILEAVKIYSTAKSSADDILRKAKPAIMLSNASGMSGAESSKTINTSLNQFEIDDTEENLLDIVDTLEFVSSQLNYDFTAGINEITEGIEASGSVAHNAGLSMQEYAAMVGLAVEKTGQDGGTIGNAYKTIISRITKASKTEGTLDEDISKAETALKGVNVQVRDSESEFRDLSDTMHDIGAVWDSLSSVEKSNVGFQVAGTRQLNVLNSLFGSWEEYESIMADIDDRTGMTMKNQEVYADSLKGHLGNLSATGQSVWSNVVNSDELKIGVDVLNVLLTIVDKLTSALGGLGTIGLVGGGILGAKNLGSCKNACVTILYAERHNVLIGDCEFCMTLCETYA